MRTIWAVRRGTGGFKGSAEAVKVFRRGPGEYVAKYTSVGGARTLGEFSSISEAIGEAAAFARSHGFDISEATTDEHLRADDIPEEFDFR